MKQETKENDKMRAEKEVEGRRKRSGRHETSEMGINKSTNSNQPYIARRTVRRSK